MRKSMLVAVAEASGLSEANAQPSPLMLRPPGAHAPAVQRAQTDACDLSVPERIIQEWKTDGKIRAEFRSLSTYAAWRTQQHCKAAGITIEEYRNQYPDVSAHIAKLETSAMGLSEKEKSDIREYADTWRKSPDIRNEFRRFECFAAYMRAKARGLIRTVGRS